MGSAGLQGCVLQGQTGHWAPDCRLQGNVHRVHCTLVERSSRRIVLTSLSAQLHLVGEGGRGCVTATSEVACSVAKPPPVTEFRHLPSLAETTSLHFGVSDPSSQVQDYKSLSKL